MVRGCRAATSDGDRAISSRNRDRARAAQTDEVTSTQRFMSIMARWPRSCPIPRHNMVSRGERELRGERRGKGGRSLLATAAPFFCIYLMFPAQAEMQRVDIYGGPAWRALRRCPPTLVADASTPAAIGAPVDEDVRAVPAPGLTLGAGTRIGFWPRATLGLDATGHRPSFRRRMRREPGRSRI